MVVETLVEQKPLWKRFVIVKYNQDCIGGIPTKSKYSSNKALWNSITKGINWFYSQTKWKINDVQKKHLFGMGFGLTYLL